MSQPLDAQYTAIYGPEVAEAIAELKSRLWPEHTETDPHDPVNQILRLFAYGVAHRDAALLDHVARELYWASLRLRSSAIALGRLIDYRLAAASPARTDQLYDLTRSLPGGGVLVGARSLFATIGGSGITPIEFELDSDDDVETAGTGVWIPASWDGSTAADYAAGGVLWVAAIVAGVPALYIGHADLQFDRVELDVSVAAAGITQGRWEYYDDLRELQPDSVTDLGGSLEFSAATVAGGVTPQHDDATGLDVTITCLRTGVSEVVTLANKTGTTAGTLGQTTVSTNPADYQVRVQWPSFEGITDGTFDTSLLEQSGVVTWSLPQTSSRRWQRATLSEITGISTWPAAVDVDAYWARFRPTVISGATSPELASPPILEAARTTWTAMFDVLQGRTVEEQLGASDGTASQEFTLTQGPLLELETVTVGDESYTVVDNFLSSAAFDKHVQLEEQLDGSQLLRFGNGSNGRIPPLGDQVVATYRIGGGDNGNVGALTIIRDRSGNPRMRNPRNPRSATGWTEQEGITLESLNNRTRAEAPASLRTLGRAVTLPDHETLAVEFRRPDDNAQVAARAHAIGEQFGLKTVGVVVVGPGGTVPPQEQLDELDEYFNGQLVGLQRVGGVAMANTEVTCTAYSPVLIGPVATIDILADFADGAQQRIEAALQGLLQPLARRQVLDVDGNLVDGGFQWIFDTEVSDDLIRAEIVRAVDGITNIALTTPAAPVPLGPNELPLIDTVAMSITIVPV